MTEPDAVLARARDEGTIFFSPIMNAWIVTRYDDVVSVLRDPELFCSKEILSITELLSPEVLELFGDEIPMEGTLIGVDPPDHTRLRAVMESSFTAEQRRVARGDDPLGLRGARRRDRTGRAPTSQSVLVSVAAARRRAAPRHAEEGHAVAATRREGLARPGDRAPHGRAARPTARDGHTTSSRCTG